MSGDDEESEPGSSGGTDMEGTHEQRVRGLGRPKGSKNKTPAQILTESGRVGYVMAHERLGRAALRRLLQ